MFNGEAYPLVELGFMDWRTYLSGFLPALEGSIKTLLPAINEGSKAWNIIRSLQQGNLSGLREAAFSGDSSFVMETMQAVGLEPTEADAAVLISSAENEARFTGTAVGIAARPLIQTFKTISIAKVLMDAAENLPDMAVASLSSSLQRRKLPVDRKKLMAEALDADGFDLFNIVLGQFSLYQERGKLRAFFDQARQLITRKSGTGTPTA
jgi:hypothetical protein